MCAIIIGKKTNDKDLQSIFQSAQSRVKVNEDCFFLLCIELFPLSFLEVKRPYLGNRTISEQKNWDRA